MSRFLNINLIGNPNAEVENTEKMMGKKVLLEKLYKILVRMPIKNNFILYYFVIGNKIDSTLPKCSKSKFFIFHLIDLLINL